MTIFGDYDVLSWKVGNGREIKFVSTSIQEIGGNRIIERERPYRDGAKLDDTGSKAKYWQIEAVFENSIQEEGLDEIPLYPTILNQLIDSFDIHETGDLTLPTRGKTRAKAESYTRNETCDEIDGARVTFVFKHDNEDNVGAAAFDQPSVRATIKQLAETTSFDAQSEGAWDTSLADLRAFGSQLEAIATFPGDTVADIDSQALIVVSTANRVGRTWERETEENNQLLADPELARTQRKLEETKDLAARARAESGNGRPKMVPFQVRGNSSIFSIASSLGQAAEDLLSINRGIDALFIPAGTVIRVFE